MVKSNEIFLITTAMCFALGAVLFAPARVTALKDVDESIGPVADDDDDYSIYPLHFDGLLDLDRTPEPSPGYYKFLEQCAKKMNTECGKEIFAGMFYEVTITKPCCDRLIAMGKECHYALLEKLLETPEFKPISSKAWLRSAQIWKMCNSINAESPSLF